MTSDTVGLFAADVSFAYGTRHALRSVSIGLRPGHLLALAGPNGSGKSTLLRLLAGSLRPTGGEIRLDGVSLRAYRLRERARKIAVVPQHANPELAFTVEALVSFGRMPHMGFLATQQL